MLFHIMIYIRLVLTTLVIISCLLGDNFVQYINHPILRALSDNATHAVIGALSGIAFICQIYDKISNLLGWILILICFTISSLIDLDHFIEARSLHLEDATALTHRPFLHNSMIPVIIFILYIIATSYYFLKISLFLAIICCAFFTHHTRDAVRRGYWFYPFGQIERISQFCYIFLIVATPYLLFYTFVVARSNFVQNFIADANFKSNEGTKKVSYRYSIV